MGSGRRKASARREPQFDADEASDADLRPIADDRPAASTEPNRRAPRAQAEPSAANDDSPSAPRPRAKPPRVRRPQAQARWARRRARPLAAVAADLLGRGARHLGRDRRGRRVRVGRRHLPPIQSLEVPKRPPTIEIVGIDGSMLATRGDMGGTDVPLKELPPYLPKAFIAIEDRRFYSPLRRRPDRARARDGRQRPAPRRLAGRLDHHPAARQEPVPDPGAHVLPQGAGGGAGAVARAQVQQERRSSSSISTASISAPAPMASRRRRSAISASRRAR